MCNKQYVLFWVFFFLPKSCILPSLLCLVGLHNPTTRISPSSTSFLLSFLPLSLYCSLRTSILENGEKPAGGREGRVINQRELVEYIILVVFVQDLVVLYIIIVESVDSYY